MGIMVILMVGTGTATNRTWESSETGFFAKILRGNGRFSEKPGFFCRSRGGSETGFLRKYCVETADLAKNPVSFVVVEGARLI